LRPGLRAAVCAALPLVFVTLAAFAQQPKIRTLTEQELMDMVQGSTIQASRNNDTPGQVARIREALKQGKVFRMIELQDLPNTWMTVTPGGVGADASAWQDVIDRAKRDHYPLETRYSVLSVEALSKYIGKPFNAVVRQEGAGAVAEALILAADLNLPLVDACMTGRSRPEINNQIASTMGVPAYPSAYVTIFGDTVILIKALNDERVDDIARAIGVASEGGTAGAMNPMTGETAKRVLVPNANTQAMQIGLAIRTAQEQHTDPVQAILKQVHGYKLFHGVVVSDNTHGSLRGFTYSEIVIQGMEEDAGHEYRISNKNENLAAFYDGKPDASAPDNIENVDPKTGDSPWGIIGAMKVGTAVVILGWPSDLRWRTPEGIRLFGPRHFGYDFDYVLIEELQARRHNPRVD
jgi:DUF917 family protein